MIKKLSSLLLALLMIAATEVRAGDCIGFIPSGGGGIFWKSVNSGALDAGKALGYDVYFRGPQDENQAAIQDSVAEMVRQRGCKAVIIAPGSLEVGATMARLKESGIPAIYVDRSLRVPAADASVSTDNLKAGQMAGEAMARRLKGKGAVLLLRMKRGWPSTDLRERGFAEAAKRRGLRVIDGGYIGTVPGEAFINATRALARHPGEFQGVFAPNEATSMGVLSALRKQQLTRHVVYIGFDLTDELANAVHSGEVEGLIVQAPHAIGYQAVQMAVAAIERKLPANRRVAVEAVYVTRDNIDSYLP